MSIHNFVNGECTVCGEDEEYYNVRHGLAEPSDNDMPVVAQPTDDDSSPTYPWNSTSGSDTSNG